MVLELAPSAGWEPLARVWRGVQTEQGWPAPAIAAGGQGLQLWFSLPVPVAATLAHHLLADLVRRYLDGAAARGARLWPTAQGEHTQPVPAPLGEASDNWSAFVAPDLAPLFAQTPWLDMPPNEDGQAQLLAGLTSLGADQWAAAQAQSQPPTPVASAAASPGDKPADNPTDNATNHPTNHPPQPPAHDGDDGDDAPRRFLLTVMNDATVPLALRIDAAKALLLSARG